MSQTGYEINVWRAWQALWPSAISALHEATSHIFTRIRQSACDNLIVDALTSSRLAKNDEGVYDHLVYLMATYQEVINLFETHFEDSLPDLAAGLCDVLSSRLSQFEASDNGNPIAREKYAILEKAVLHLSAQIAAVKEAYSPTQLCAEGAAISGNMDFKTLYDHVAVELAQPLYAMYQETLTRALVNLDDMYMRKTVGYYTDLLESEWEVLGLIIQVQVLALESSYWDTEAIPLILTKLREAYQQTGPIISGLRKLMQVSQQAQPSAMSQEEFTAWLTTITAPEKPIEIDNSDFTAALLPVADMLYEEIKARHLETLYALHYAQESETALTSAVLTVFEDALANLIAAKPSPPVEPEDTPGHEEYQTLTQKPDETEENKANITSEPEQQTPSPTAIHEADESNAVSTPQPPSVEDEILTGITESLDIKLDVIKEGLAMFLEAGEKLFSSISANMPTLTGQVLEAATYDIKKAWCQNPPQEEYAAQFLINCGELEPFARYNSQLSKLITDGTAKADKNALRFKKETLLYEVSTFEEIQYYSVSRLRESDFLHVQAAVKIIDDTFSSLHSILQENNIELIHPIAHEPFNGKEHEVLTAEVHAEHKKGEVIKTMTSGYKQNNQVILRANVVAAR